MEIVSAAAQVEHVRRNVGVWFLRDHTFLRFSGLDVASWLQTQTTNDVVALRSGQGHANALLDRKGRLQAHFTVHRWEDEYWLIVEKHQARHLLEELDAHLFLERVQIADAGHEVELLALQGPRSVHLVSSLMESFQEALDRLPREPYGVRPVVAADLQVLVIRMSLTGEDGFLLVTQRGEGERLMSHLITSGAMPVDEEAVDILRIEAGRPRFGVDMDTTFRISETTLEREAVSYEKGCYLGQEVVARLRAYGTLKQALMGLKFEAHDSSLPSPGTPILVQDKRIGEIRSSTFSPTLGCPIALAYLDREHRAPGTKLWFSTSEGSRHGAEIVVLPFYDGPPPMERAKALYEQALDRFERDALDEDDTAIELLKEALLLDPTFEDAYEALGVILNRHGRVDEAIQYMQILANLNPDCVMAHTNLSVFYVSKGMIEEAEMEKAQASVLEIKAATEAKKAEELAAAERERIRAEALERIAMFREVLEFDPDDSLATFGMGVAYMQLNQYEEAIPYLQHATQVTKDYSAAYLNLGKCHEFLGRLDRAREVFHKGIDVASRKGDLMPMREMERRLKALEGPTAGTQE